MAKLVHPHDEMGTLYTSDGLRLDCSTADFMSYTASLENARPGVRSEIVTEAQCASLWATRCVPEIVFLAAAVQWRSALVALVFTFGFWLVEYLRCLIFGAYFLYNGVMLSKLWSWLRYLAFPLVGVVVWGDNRMFAVLIFAFIIPMLVDVLILIFQFAIAGTLFRFLYLRFGEGWYTNPVKASIVRSTLQRWTTRIDTV